MVLGSIGSERAVEPLITKLDDPEAEVRRASLEALSQNVQEIDRCLLTMDLDGVQPFLDPRQEISTEFASKAAEKLGLAIEDVQARYEALAERFHLRLAWKS
jgi:HEAT repeat protein